MQTRRLVTSSTQPNSPFPSSGLPLFQNESKCETILMKMCLTYKFIFLQIKLIFMWKVLHENSFCDRGKPELGNGLFDIKYINGRYLNQFAPETIENWYTHSLKGGTPTDLIKLCFHDNPLFSIPLGSVFNILMNSSQEN